MRVFPEKLPSDAFETWVDLTHQIQKINGVELTPFEELDKEWKEMKPRQRRFHFNNVRTHKIIIDMANLAAVRRNN